MSLYMKLVPLIVKYDVRVYLQLSHTSLSKHVLIRRFDINRLDNNSPFDLEDPVEFPHSLKAEGASTERGSASGHHAELY